MDSLERVTLITAIWGALTGTLALVVQALQYFADRGKLVVAAHMSQRVDRANPKSRISVDVDVVNLGRRPISIEHVGIMLPNPPKKEKEVVRNMRTSTPLFDAQSANKLFRLEEGQKHTFRSDPFPQAWGRALYAVGKKGTAFVRLTNGKEYRATFYLIDPAHFPKTEP